MNPEIRTIYAAKHREAARLFRETHPDAGVTYPAGVWNRVTPTSAAHRVQKARDQAAAGARISLLFKACDIPVLTPQKVTKALRTNQKRELGQGRFSIATLVHWNGAEAVMKTPVEDSAWIFVEELMHLRHLRGAGGSPIALGLCPNPPALFISFVGHQTLENYLQEKRTDEELVEVAIDLCIKIQEIHQKHVIHHDLKEDNVLVDAQGKVHVIDFGNADMEGEKCCYCRASWSPMWMAPEVFSVVLSHPIQDVYSVGHLLMTIAEVMESPQNLEKIAMGFLEEKPEKRQTLHAGLTLLMALRGACEPQFVTDTSDVEASLSH